MNAVEAAWVAGILEGEGAFLILWKTDKQGAPLPNFRVSCNMTDEDIILRLAATAGVGRVAGPCGQSNPAHKPFWRWNVNRRADVLALLGEIAPHMGLRRTAKILEIQRIAAESPPRRAVICGTRHGYETGCRCDDCRSAHAARHRARRARAAAAKQA